MLAVILAMLKTSQARFNVNAPALSTIAALRSCGHAQRPKVSLDRGIGGCEATGGKLLLRVSMSKAVRGKRRQTCTTLQRTRLPPHQKGFERR